ncbi:MAG TPA: methylated-DNA--[protein]-cysteine S-methyltransferase, partial [Dongiaceae bacterium]
MVTEAFTIFDTAIGPCGAAWSRRGLTALQLPEADAAETRARMARRFPDARELAPPPGVQRALDRVVALLRGEGSDLQEIPLDMDGVPEFHRRVYEAARAIPPGETLSYGEVAAKIGADGAARAVGQALGRNPYAIIVPCHRVLAAGGKVGGFSANGGIATKMRLLGIEGVKTRKALPLFDGDGAFAFDPDEAIAHLRQADGTLAQLIDAVGPFRMELRMAPSLFAALAEAIVYQQLTGKAAATIHGRVCALFPRKVPTADRLLRLTDPALRDSGLSRSKILSLRDLAKRTADGAVPTLAEAHRMDDAPLVERLMEVRGIGRWTAEMLLMFRLGRPDVLPVDDYGIRKGFGYAFRKRKFPTQQIVAKHGERWRPYRTVASWYLWRAAERAGRTKR